MILFTNYQQITFNKLSGADAFLLAISGTVIYVISFSWEVWNKLFFISNTFALTFLLINLMLLVSTKKNEYVFPLVQKLVIIMHNTEFKSLLHINFDKIYNYT